MKKGFTLIELLGVIILLGVLALIVYPVVDSSIKQSRQRAYDRTIDGIVEAAKIYGKQNKLSYDGFGSLTLAELKEAGVLENKDVINPTTNTTMNGCVMYRWNDDDNQFDYFYDEECSITPTKCFTYRSGGSSLDFIINYQQCVTFVQKQNYYSNSDIELYCNGEEASDGYDIYRDIRNNSLTIQELQKNNVISYPELPTNRIVITGYDKSCGENVVIPAKIDGKEVVGIDDSAFVDYYYPVPVSTELFEKEKEYLKTMENTNFKNDGVTNVKRYTHGQIPVGIPLNFVDFSNAIYLEYIGNEAFSSCGLNEVEFGNINNLVSIDDYAFADNNLTSIQIPNSVEYLSGFSENLLSEITIPENVKRIGESAFSENRIKSLTIPKNVTDIEAYAFESNQLTHITIPETISEIAYGVFSNNQIQTISLPNNITAIHSDAFYDNQIEDLDLRHLTKLTSIDGFSNNRLTNVLLPNNITTIESSAFYRNQLSNIEIPTSVVMIENNAFGYNQFSGTLDLSHLTNLKSLSGFADNQITNVIFPSNITTIGLSAFERNQLSNIKVPTSVVTIENDAFRSNQFSGTLDLSYLINLKSLSGFAFNQITEVIIPNNVETIGNEAYFTGAFYYNKITKLTIPEGVKTIGRDAFSDNKIQTLTLPNSLIEIGINAFAYNSLTSIIVPSNVTTIKNSAFSKKYSSNKNLITIINKTGKAFDWGIIVNGSSSATTYNFVTGTIINSYGNVTVNAN